MRLLFPIIMNCSNPPHKPLCLCFLLYLRAQQALPGILCISLERVFLFRIGFIVPLFVLFALFKPVGAVFWILVVLCAACSVVCAYFSKHLFRAKLFSQAFYWFISPCRSISLFSANLARCLRALWLQSLRRCLA